MLRKSGKNDLTKISYDRIMQVMPAELGCLPLNLYTSCFGFPLLNRREFYLLEPYTQIVCLSTSYPLWSELLAACEAWLSQEEDRKDAKLLHFTCVNKAIEICEKIVAAKEARKVREWEEEDRSQ